MPLLTGQSGNTQRNAQGVPYLDREAHEFFLTDFLEDAHYLPYDPQRPWVLYWTLNGLAMLGVDTSSYAPRYVRACFVDSMDLSSNAWLSPQQHPAWRSDQA